MSRLTLFIVLAFLYTVTSAPVCDLDFCTCYPAAHPKWTTVNCTVPLDQDLDILPGDLPDTTTDLVINGGQALSFDAYSLTRLKDARHISIAGTQLIRMRKYAAQDLNIISIYLEIESCDVLRIEERTFSNIKGPLSVAIRDCDVVSLENSAFSWLLMMEVSNVNQLNLSPEVFMLDPSAANFGQHGPGMSIALSNLTVPEFPAQAFGSSAAAINMDFVQVRAIRSSAFSANTYNNVMATNCSFHLIEGDAFAQKSLINNLQLYGCKIHQFSTKALQSAISTLNVSHTRFDNIETGAITTTVAAILITDNTFHNFMERGFELSSWNKFHMERNKFDEVAPYAIVAPGSLIHEMVFSENEIETAKPNSLAFIGHAYAKSARHVKYKNNYYGQTCHCNVSSWLAESLGAENAEPFESESSCTVDEFFARCFNEPSQNMVFKKFLDGVCTEKSTIQCEVPEEVNADIQNTRFPHKKDDDEENDDTERNNKVIGIVIVTCLGCVIIALFFSLIKWIRRKGYCTNVKNFISRNSSCGALCDRMCGCGRNNGLDNARSISQLSVNEYSERHRLNEPRVQENVQETRLPEMYAEQVVPMDDKTTQTLPEELTKELLENLREKLEDPDNYVEAREMIEHLYELIKVEESCNANNLRLNHAAEENIYELPFQNTTPRIGKNQKQMISVGTRTPSIDKLMPLSPYNRQTALAHEYFEPKDFAVHLYAEIANADREKKNLLGIMPDVVQADQAIPRGPYLRAVRDKLGASASASPSVKSMNNSIASPQHTSTIKSNKSTLSNSSGRMINRPLPEKPANLDLGEGTSSYSHG